MNTKQMACILELAKTLNFNRAAENLYITQPTMTYQIRSAEEEIGFDLFTRSGRGAALTPAGAQFITTLRTVYDTLQAAIEQGQNFHARYQDQVRIALPIRSALYFLPDVIRSYGKAHPDVAIIPFFDWHRSLSSFLAGEQDILFAMDHEMNHAPDTKKHPLFDSRIYLITENNDPLAKKTLIHPNDLTGRTLMVGGGSPPALRALQQQLIRTVHLDYFNSHDHDTTLTNVAAGRGVCLAPGFLNDHSGEFAWTPFETDVTIPCSLYTHKGASNKHIDEVIRAIQKSYNNYPDFAV